MKNKSLRNFLIIGFTLATLLPILLYGVTTIFYSTRSLENEINKKHDLLISMLKQQIENYLLSPLDDLHTLKDYIEKNQLTDNGVNKILNSVLLSHQYFVQLQVIDLNGIVTHVAPSKSEFLSIDMSQRPFFKIPVQRWTEYWSSTFISPFYDEPLVAISIPFQKGIINGYISLKSIINLITTIKLTEDSYITMTDQKGIFIYHRDIDKVNQREYDTNYDNFKKAYLGKRYDQTLLIDGIPHRSYINFLKQTNWSIAIYQPIASIYRPIEQLYILFFLALLLLLVVIIVFSAYQYSIITRTLKKFIINTETIAGGKYEKPIVIENFKEFSELSSNLNSMAAKIQDREKALKLSNEDLKSLLYAASHDLRTPLINIQGFSSELKIGLEIMLKQIDETSIEYEEKQIIREQTETLIENCFPYIIRSINKMDTLLKGLLKIGFIINTPIESEIVDLNLIFNKILTNFDNKITGQNAVATISLLPPCYGNRELLFQLFSYLIDNAVKFLNTKRKGTIHIEGKQTGNMCVYTIKDNGFGIQKKHLSKIFNLFHKIPVHNIIEGEGLGLTLARQITQKLAGYITIESVIDKGTICRVTLPYNAPADKTV